MRVLSLVTEAYGGRGGIAQASRDVVDALAALGEIEHVDIVPRHARDAPLGLPAKARQRAPRHGRLAYAAAALEAARERPDIVWCNHLYMSPLAALIARAAGAKLVIQLHGIEIWSAPAPLRRRALEAADFVWCVSRDTRARALSLACIAPERVLVISNCVGPEFVPGDRTFARARFEFGSETVLLTVGRLDPRERYKGHDRVIGALPALRREVTYAIAGEGEDRARLEALAGQRGVAKRVRFLAHVERAGMPDLYRAADFFVLPSTGEGFGIAFIEAMACGAPAIGLAHGGASDALADGELGTCVAEADFAEALARAVCCPRPDPQQLSASVHARFGRAVLRERVAQAIALLH